MTANVPAIRYELFVKAFEKKVTAAQAEIERLRQMEQPYNVVKEVMEAARLPNHQTIAMTSGHIGITITATAKDSMAAFEALAERIGAKLLEADMHADGIPSTSHGGLSPCLWFSWHCLTRRQHAFNARLFVSLPLEGLTDCEVTEMERVTIELQYRVARKEPPIYPAPPAFGKAMPTAAEMARIEVELGAIERE